MSPTVRTAPVELATADGLALEGEVAIPADVAAAALLAHPHPRNGGDMHSSVIDALFAGLPPRGVAVLRFNFRGVGRSGGSYGDGVGEQHDVEAGIDALCAAVPGVAPAIAGWSFGADVSLRVVDERVAGWFLVAPPLAVVPFAEMAAAADPRPKQLAVPEHDEFRPPDAAREATAGWANTEVDVIPGTSHFLVGRTADVVDRAAAFLLP